MGSKTNKPPISVSKLARCMKDAEGKGKTAVIVGAVTDDIRLTELPALRVCALRFTTGARARILKAGGECLTFDQLLSRPLSVRTRSSSLAPRRPARPRS